MTVAITFNEIYVQGNRVRMKPDTGAWSNTGEGKAGWPCPACGAALPAGVFAAGQRLARCRRCGKMVHRETTQGWPVSGALDRHALQPQAYQEPDRLEIFPAYPYPVLACPYCEHLNQDGLAQRPDGQQFCGNCGADLKKPCLNCGEPMYILDHFCTRCRADQERTHYEIEGVYRQRFNEGKRLAQMQRWQDAERELGLFFNPAPTLDRDQVRLAHQIYVSSIAPADQGEGLRLYNEAVEQLRKTQAALRRRRQRQKYYKWLAVAAVVLLLGIFSAVTLGSWWAIFVIVPVASLVILLIGWIILAHLGLS